LGISQNIVLVFALLSAAGCRRSIEHRAIEPVYDNNGRLQLLKYDRNHNGTVDTWSYMDGSRIVRIELDQDENGTIDRWEHYDDTGRTLVKVGFSRAQDGKEDAWSYFTREGALDRIEVSTRRDGAISRVEHYSGDRLTRAEEDTDGDGRMDKWETYEGDRLAVVAFDTRHRGAPDRRLTYGADGSTRLEIDAAGNGQFAPAVEGSGAASSRSPR
jgi:hypothetical protein